MATNELKKEYFELLKEELARKEAIKADLSEKIKDKENRYWEVVHIRLVGFALI